MAGERGDADLGLAGTAGFVASLGVVIIVAGAALGLVHYAGGSPVERGLEGGLGSLALGGVVAAPGILCLLALADRPALILPAGVVLMPLSALSFAGVTLPLLIPAIMLFVAYGRRSAAHPVGALRSLLTTIGVVGLLVAATVALFVHEDPRSYSTPRGGGATSNVISTDEAPASLALVGGAVGSGWLLAGPRSRSSTSAVRTVSQ